MNKFYNLRARSQTQRTIFLLSPIQVFKQEYLLGPLLGLSVVRRVNPVRVVSSVSESELLDKRLSLLGRGIPSPIAGVTFSLPSSSSC